MLNHRIVGVRPADTAPITFPDMTLVQEMASIVSLPACTIDVAVLGNQTTVLIEVHPFISCGLYGLEGSNLLRMARTAWQHHLGHDAK